jgi:hypothetical protein
MLILFDVKTMRRDILGVFMGMAAMRQTVSDTGYGAVLASRRKLTAAERSARLEDRRQRRAAGDAAARMTRQIQGWDIANFLASQGHDPYEYPPEDTEFAAKSVEEEIGEAIEDAYRTGRSQKQRIIRVLTAAAAHLEEAAREQIATGKLGTNTAGWRSAKARRAQRDPSPRRQSVVPVTTEYGIPPPYGVYSGRFIKGIRSTHFAKRPPSIIR